MHTGYGRRRISNAWEVGWSDADALPEGNERCPFPRHVLAFLDEKSGMLGEGIPNGRWCQAASIRLSFAEPPDIRVWD